MTARFSFPAPDPDPAEDALRAEVRAFLDAERASGGFSPVADCWVSGASPEFSAKVGAQGWLGMTWPERYGGSERPPLHRHVVTEELLAAGAPVAAHWVADRQSGGHILKYGTEAQKAEILPRIAAGTCYFAIGMSEPQAGSDLAAVQTKATRLPGGGWRMDGRKIWSTGAHRSHYMIVLARTSPAEGRNRQAGLSQFLVDLSTPGITISGIEDLAGSVHFNETLFDGAELPEDALLGVEGEGWAQCMSELAMERSGPERFLTAFLLIDETLEALRGRLDDRGHAVLGRFCAHLTALRRMSRGIARRLAEGAAPEVEAALVKELGNRLEKETVDGVRRLLGTLPPGTTPRALRDLLNDTILRLPSHTLRGGTTEVMRGIIARQLGVR
ncbi:MAG: acyl-CoA dehydrogenase family protein [Pseudomonadota bacterium]